MLEVPIEDEIQEVIQPLPLISSNDSGVLNDEDTANVIVESAALAEVKRALGKS